MPHARRAPTMRSAPPRGFSRAIRRIRSRVSRSIRGRPGPLRRLCRAQCQRQAPGASGRPCAAPSADSTSPSPRSPRSRARSSSPSMRTVPQRGFSVASLAMSPCRSLLIGRRPGCRARLFHVQYPRHAGRCQRDDRLRLHDHQGGTRGGPIPREPRPEETVAGFVRVRAR